MAKVELKQPIVDEIKGVLDGAQGAVVVDYRGLTVEQDTRLRKQLREAGGDLQGIQEYPDQACRRRDSVFRSESRSGRPDCSGRIQGRRHSSRKSSGQFRQDCSQAGVKSMCC